MPPACQVKDWFAPGRPVSESEIKAAMTGFPRQLSWRDFRPVGHSLQPPASAKTSADWNYAWGTRLVADHYVVRGVRATVRPKHGAMWAIKADESPDLLQHEQGHYDITGLIVRDFARGVLGLAIDIEVVAKVKEAGSTAASRQRWVDQLFDTEIERLKNEANALNALLQTNPQTRADGVYDIQTRHGTDVNAQTRWNNLLRRLMAQNVNFKSALRAEGLIR